MTRTIAQKAALTMTKVAQQGQAEDDHIFHGKGEFKMGGAEVSNEPDVILAEAVQTKGLSPLCPRARCRKKRDVENREF